MNSSYSTCSVHRQENEDVVEFALLAANAKAGEVSSAGTRWELTYALPNWHRRGSSPTLEHADRCIQCDPVHDGMNGFFLALLERRSLGTAEAVSAAGLEAAGSVPLQDRSEDPEGPSRKTNIDDELAVTPAAKNRKRSHGMSKAKRSSRKKHKRAIV